LETVGIGKNFLSRTLAIQQFRERMDKLDYMKLKSFCTTKEMVSKLRMPLTEWEKIFASCAICIFEIVSWQLSQTAIFLISAS
jgi:hypothetical protein